MNNLEWHLLAIMEIVINSDVCIGTLCSASICNSNFFPSHLSIHMCSMLRTHLLTQEEGVDHPYSTHGIHRILIMILWYFFIIFMHYQATWGKGKESVAFGGVGRRSLHHGRVQAGANREATAWQPDFSLQLVSCSGEQVEVNFPPTADKLLTLRARRHLLPTIKWPHIHTCGGGPPAHQIGLSFWVCYKRVLLMDAEISIHILCRHQTAFFPFFSFSAFYDMWHRRQRLAYTPHSYASFIIGHSHYVLYPLILLHSFM